MAATSPAISIVGKEDSERAVATIVTGFTADPIVRWVLPEPHQYLTHAPDLVRRLCGPAFEHEGAYVVEGFAGAALWLRPGVERDNEGVAELMQRATSESEREKHAAFFGRVGEHHLHDPHWYLPMIGIDPAQQGRGLGSALLARALTDVDREHLPAYLEATSERSRDLYARHGFELLATVQMGDSPPMFPMLRAAR
jgi:ribosomal protein S18 acetylase RimI-like enzyme